MSAKVDNPDGSLPLRDRAETYCQLYSTGTYSATEAYRLAGYAKKDADSASCRLSVKVSVKARIRFIQAGRAEKEHVSRETLASDYRSAYAVAEKEWNAAGMVAATTGKARLYGFDKQVIETHADEPMTRSEQEEADDWAEFNLWKAGRSGPRVVSIQGDA